MDEADRQLAAATSLVLGLGQSLALINRVLLGGGLALLLVGARGAVVPVLLCWAVGEWFAARVILDQRLLGEAARAPGLLAGLDQLLGKAARPMASRARGALRLLRMQAVAAGGTALSLVLGFIWQVAKL